MVGALLIRLSVLCYSDALTSRLRYFYIYVFVVKNTVQNEFTERERYPQIAAVCCLIYYTKIKPTKHRLLYT